MKLKLLSPNKLVLVCLAFHSILSSLSGQTGIPVFISEEGMQTPLVQGSSIPSSAVGVISWPFDFSATEIDNSTGLYVKPDYVACYSAIHETMAAADYVTAGYPMVFGNHMIWASVTVLGFNNTTGIGSARAILPIGAMTSNKSWGVCFEGETVLDLYWGTPAELSNNGFTPPSSPAGNAQWTVTGEILPLSLTFPQNRGMEVFGTYSAVLDSDTPVAYDRVFTITAEHPTSVQTPSTVTLPANETRVVFSISPLAVGSGHLIATEASSGIVVQSQIAEVSRSLDLVVSGATPASSPGTSSEDRYCHPSRAYKWYEPGSDAHITVCGPCVLEPATHQCDAGVGLNGTAFAYHRFYCSSAVVLRCVETSTPSSLLVQMWSFDSFYAEPCQEIVPFTIDGHTSFHMLWRMCCIFVPIDDAQTRDVPDCERV